MTTETTNVVGGASRNIEPAASAFSNPSAPEGRVAVVLVHGMGEQRPMTTIREFAKAYAETRTGPWDSSTGPSQTTAHPLWSIPDRYHELFELHTYTVPAEKGDRTKNPHPTGQVDFYEGYWASDMDGTKMAHLRSFSTHVIWHLLHGKLPSRLAWLLIPLILLPLIGAGLAWWAFAKFGEAPWWGTILKVAGIIVVAPLAAWMTGSLGDVARYMDNRVANVVVRQRIRTNLVGLMEHLHEGRYRRIVLIGHSLGGVVAYDALRLLWARRMRDTDVKDVLHAAKDLEEDDVRAAVFAELSALSAGTSRWLVSDLVTIGSPIAYPELLMTPPGLDLSELTAERELPTCPPEPAGDRGSKPPAAYCYQSMSGPGGSSLKVFHHAAVFCATRWTNIYACGDFVGGTVREDLGKGADDIRICHSRDGKSQRIFWAHVPVASHTKYWKKSEGRAEIFRVIDEAARAARY